MFRAGAPKIDLFGVGAPKIDLFGVGAPNIHLIAAPNINLACVPFRKSEGGMVTSLLARARERYDTFLKACAP
jgi:hypothetical protein